MATPFVILSKPRSGSSFLRDNLNSHPAIRVYGEMLLPEPRGDRPLWEPNDIEFACVYVKRHMRPRLQFTRPYWTVRYLQRVFDQPSCRAAGMKLMYEQVRRWPEAMAYVTTRRVRVLHLVRRNLLDIVLSEMVRDQTGVWHVTSDGRPEQPGKVRSLDELKLRVDPEALFQWINHLARNQQVFRTWLAASRTPTLEVEYEQLVADHSLFGGILEFLGMEASDWRLLQTGHEKVNTKTHGELIENMDEVEARLKGTPYASFLVKA